MNRAIPVLCVVSCAFALGCDSKVNAPARNCSTSRELTNRVVARPMSEGNGRGAGSNVKDVFDDVNVPVDISTNLPMSADSNTKEREDLERVVLPGIAKFDGSLVDPIALFAWLEKEAIAHDPAKEKVKFIMQISSNDVPSGQGEVQRRFDYRKGGDRDRITLPDAAMVYGSLSGFIIKFETNCVVVRSTIEEVTRWHKSQGSHLFDHVELPEDRTSTNHKSRTKNE